MFQTWEIGIARVTINFSGATINCLSSASQVEKYCEASQAGAMPSGMPDAMHRHFLSMQFESRKVNPFEHNDD
jgi:hypothetical protein